MIFKKLRILIIDDFQSGFMISPLEEIYEMAELKQFHITLVCDYETLERIFKEDKPFDIVFLHRSFLFGFELLRSRLRGQTQFKSAIPSLKVPIVATSGDFDLNYNYRCLRKEGYNSFLFKHCSPEDYANKMNIVIQSLLSKNHDWSLLALGDMLLSMDASKVINYLSGKKYTSDIAIKWYSEYLIEWIQRNSENEKKYKDRYKEKEDDRSIRELVCDLNSGNVFTRTSASKKLAKIGTPALENIFELISNDKTDDIARQLASETISMISDYRAVDPLTTALKDDCIDIRKAATEGLGNIGDERAVEPLVDLLEDKNWAVRRAAVFALADIGGLNSIEYLIEAIQDEKLFVTIEVGIALGEITGKYFGADSILWKQWFDSSPLKKK